MITRSNCLTESEMLQGETLLSDWIVDLMRDCDWTTDSGREDVCYYDEESLMKRQQDALKDPWEVNGIQLPWEIEKSCYEYEVGGEEVQL